MTRPIPTCLVTGVAGFIGSHLAETLIDEGHSVIGVDCFTDYYPKRLKVSNIASLRRRKDFRFIEADLSSARLSPLMRGVEYVFHLAAQPGVRASWGASFSDYVKHNITATQRLLESVRGWSIEKFIYASSSSIYGDAEELPTREETTPKPVSPYGVSKLAAERLCYAYFRSYSVPVVTLRYFTVYGPRQRPDMAFSIFIDNIYRGKKITIYGDGSQKRDYTYVGDVVSATRLAMGGSAGAIYNVGNGTSTPLVDIITTIESLVDRTAKVTRRSFALGDVRNTSADISRISKELGYRPEIPLVEGLRRQVAIQIRRVT